MHVEGAKCNSRLRINRRVFRGRWQHVGGSLREISFGGVMYTGT